MACPRDPTQAIDTRLRFMLQTFLQHYRETAGNDDNHGAVKFCYAASIWYYRILENILSQEKGRLGLRHTSVFLELDLFQRSLVACCLEITISSKSLPYEFPLLLQVLTLAPYHFIKVIELVLRAEKCLPRAVVKHLAQSEEKVLECLAWTSDSPLWEAIRANEGSLPTCQQVMPPEKLEGSNTTDVQPDRTRPEDMSVEFSFGAEPSSSTDPQHPSAERLQRTNSLHLFARKVYMLMGKRLSELCSTLRVSEELRLKIWTCFEHSLVQYTELMVDRHLDQLLMCAIYLMSKITNVEMPFKHIMNCYKSQPLASRIVCKDVLISGTDEEMLLTGNNNNGDPVALFPTPDSPSLHYPGPSQEKRGNLILFYNQIYTEKMHHFAEQFDPASGGDTPPLSPYPSLPIPNPPPITETPANREEEDKEELEDEDGPPAQRLRVNGESAWQRRLRNVANSRVARGDRDQPST
ncbi:retinoblastoma-like protein 2 isoform X2 [Eleginops maclovinus]|uniref:retinoblastoma-like protein 2 isoform X2 n=1 Tax=Eleginops maclovinus TaxID=56733 RepID=UPI003080CD5C